VADLGPNKKRIAQLLRMLGSSGGERKNAFVALERSMQKEDVTWTDLGDWIEHDADGKYTESEMQEFAQAVRAEGVEAGIKIGEARAANGNGNGNGHITLPELSEMAEYCTAQRGRLEVKHHSFVDNIPFRARRRTLTLKETGYLASLYIQLGGKC
jgi:hypothetical protein